MIQICLFTKHGQLCLAWISVSNLDIFWNCRIRQRSCLLETFTSTAPNRRRARWPIQTSSGRKVRLFRRQRAPRSRRSTRGDTWVSALDVQRFRVVNLHERMLDFGEARRRTHVWSWTGCDVSHILFLFCKTRKHMFGVLICQDQNNWSTNNVFKCSFWCVKCLLKLRYHLKPLHTFVVIKITLKRTTEILKKHLYSIV